MTTVKQTVKAFGGDTLNLYVHEWGVARGKSPRGAIAPVVVERRDGCNNFYVDGHRIDRLGVAMKVWGETG